MRAASPASAVVSSRAPRPASPMAAAGVDAGTKQESRGDAIRIAPSARSIHERREADSPALAHHLQPWRTKAAVEAVSGTTTATVTDASHDVEETPQSGAPEGSRPVSRSRRLSATTS